MAAQHSPEKQAAVIAALLEGQSVSAVAKEYKIPRSTVSRWKSDKIGEQLQRPDVSDLLLEYLTTNLATLKKQAVFFANIEWLEKQSASELAVLHGVMSDKTMRILEAYGRATE